MKQIYCDNASTSFPKAPGLGKAMGTHIDTNGYNISRGGYRAAYSLESQIIDIKETVCQMFGHDNPKEVIFTPGATIGLNMILKGLLKRGDHIITTSMEHNAVVRPLAQLAVEGVTWSEAACSPQGELDTEDLRKRIRPQTKMILAIHGSNVCGTLTPIEEIGRICWEHKLYFCIDGSQTAGSAILDLNACHADALVFPGHKALLGPQGIGGMILRSSMAEELIPLFAGGTGSASDKEDMPDDLPDKLQPGTLNVPGIIGLGHSLAFIKNEGLYGILQKKQDLTKSFIEDVGNMKGVRLVGLTDEPGRCSVVSLDFCQMDNAEASYILENQFGIMTRCGLHCSPHAHKTLGTFPRGTVRFSFGYFNTLSEVRQVISALNKLVRN